MSLFFRENDGTYTRMDRYISERKKDQGATAQKLARFLSFRR